LPNCKFGGLDTDRPNGRQFSDGYLEWFTSFEFTAEARLACAQKGECTALGRLRKEYATACPEDQEIPVKVQPAGEDPCAGNGAKIPLYKVSVYEKPDPHSPGVWKEACQNQRYIPRPADRCTDEQQKALSGKAILVKGYWDEKTGKHVDKDPKGNDVYTFACVTGAIGKCAHWGYASSGEPSPYHLACVDAVRARYCDAGGDSFTCTDTDIDIYDRDKVQTMGDPAGKKVESVWGKDGLVCLTKKNARWPGCDGQLEGCEQKGDCPAVIDDAYWSAHPGSLLAVSVRGGNKPKCDPPGSCCVQDAKHCP
jgi:hypothetical protein